MEAVVYGVVAGIVGYGLSVAFAVEQKFTVENGRLDELNLKGSKYGESIPYALGCTRLGMNMTWCDQMQEHVSQLKQDSGGKGGGGGSITTTTYSYTADYGGILSYNPQSYPLRIYLDKELVWEQAAGEYLLSGDLTGGGSFEFLTGADDQPPPAVAEAILGAGNTPAYRGRCTIWFNDVPCTTGTRPNVEVEVSSLPGGSVIVNDLGQTIFSPPAVPLREVLELVATEAGIDAAFIDAAGIDSDIVGVTLQAGSAGSSIELLMTAYNIQGTFRGDSYKFSSINQPVPDWSIPETDLIVDGKSIFPIRMVRDEDLPNAVYIKYLDIDRNHQSCTQRAFRKTGRSTSQLTLTVPGSMTATSAAQLAESILYRAWIGQRKYGPFTLGRKYLHLEVGDIVKVEYGSRVHTMRLLKITYGANLAMRIEAEAYDPSVATLVSTGASGDFEGKGLPTFGDTHVAAFNLPALTGSVVDKFGFYLAATGTGSAWKGGILEVSRDGAGGGWVQVAEHPAPSIMGQATTILPPPAADVDVLHWDLDSTVDVTLYTGQLSSVTSTEIFAGGNAFVIGDEVIQARDVLPFGGGVYRLSTLLRGRRGTREAMSAHVIGEQFAVASQLTFCELPSSDRGMTLPMRFTPYGGGVVAEFTFIFDGLSAEPWRPEYLAGSRDGSNNITFSFRPTTRRVSELPNIGETPPEYSPRKALLTVYGGDWSWVAKQVELTDVDSYILTAADQVAIWGWTLTDVNIGVRQYSPYYGWGVENRATVET